MAKQKKEELKTKKTSRASKPDAPLATKSQGKARGVTSSPKTATKKASAAPASSPKASKAATAVKPTPKPASVGKKAAEVKKAPLAKAVPPSKSAALKPAASKSSAKKPSAGVGKRAGAVKPGPSSSRIEPANLKKDAGKPAKAAKKSSTAPSGKGGAKKPAAGKTATTRKPAAGAKAAAKAKKPAAGRRSTPSAAAVAHEMPTTHTPAGSSATVAAPPRPGAAAPSPYVERMFARELPGDYGDTKIVALVRDPEWVFLYWEISDAARQHLAIPRGAHSKPMALRVYDVTGVHFDGENAHSFYDVEINDLAASWYLRIPESERAYVVDLGTYDTEGRFQVIARSNAVSVPPAGMSTVADEQWMNVTDDQFAEIYRMSGGLRLHQQTGSAEFGRRPSEEIVAELRRQWVGSGMWSGASGAVQAAPVTRKGFWLEVGCDVIVYGATEPGASVTLQGRAIQLSPDGRFHARFTLPDSRIEFPVRAVSPDGEDAREVMPVVTRETH